MGAMRRIRHRGPAIGLAAVAATFALVACEPGDGLNTAAVAITTDQKGTSELEERGVDVQWLTCTASYGEKSASTPSATVRNVASVDCVGETGDGQDISIKGQVTQEVNGTCVRGDLTATVGGNEVFRLNVLGNCQANTPTPPVNNPTTRPPDQPGATVTVTRTQTVYPNPSCSCISGK